jgi:hypothetical protein
MINPAKPSIANPASPAKQPGRLISELLAAKRLRPRDIEQKSRLIADSRGNSGFYISHASLAAIKAGATPSIYKVFSLAACCGVSYAYLLSLFGIVGDSPVPSQAAEAAPETALVEDCNFRFRLNFDIAVTPEETRLISLDEQYLHFLPTDLASSLEPTRLIYAVVGLNDDSMSNVIPAGSLVEVDRDQTEVPSAGWRTLQERPIFLLWHEQGYSCGWCQITKNQLFLIPHPASGRPILQLRIPNEVVIIGRVIHVWYYFGSRESAPKYVKRIS